MRAFAYLGAGRHHRRTLSPWVNQGYIKQQWNWYLHQRPFLSANVQPYVLSATAEGALKPGWTRSVELPATHRVRTIVRRWSSFPQDRFVMGQTPGASPQGWRSAAATLRLHDRAAVCRGNVRGDIRRMGVPASLMAIATSLPATVTGGGDRGAGDRHHLGPKAQQYVRPGCPGSPENPTGCCQRLNTNMRREPAAPRVYPWGNSVQLNGQVIDQLQRVRQPVGWQANGGSGRLRFRRISCPGLQDMLGNVT